MKRQVAKVINHGIYKVIHDDEKTLNPYVVYFEAAGRRKKLVDYADLISCMYFIADNITED